MAVSASNLSAPGLSRSIDDESLGVPASWVNRSLWDGEVKRFTLKINPYHHLYSSFKTKRKLAEYVSLCGRTCQERYQCIHNHSAHSRGVQVIIAGAGGASHLSAMS
ncbi:hypothetical protein F2Q70_00005051 [Brassica cretica]|uniref:Uncharacterized protein n=1 Tax=Brassica cretica TaxID=69181 RepID=A0A8S9IST2_BRACR|nr:hypothetical protein F2Q70_00005051 [Brassica cretica]KAF3567404.1 hypothetical protein DY000_02017152 [Brassica cretica]